MRWLFFLSIVYISLAFAPQRNQKSSTSLLAEKKPLAAATSLLKKSKRKAIDAFLKEIEEEGDNHIVTKFLNNGERPIGIDDPINFYNKTKCRDGTVTIWPEYNKVTKTGFIMGMPPPEIMGGVLRDAGSRAVVVSLDKRSGGASPNDFERFTKEQRRARLFSPGPIPIVWHDFVVDKIQVTHAAALGAGAIMLYPELIENLEDIVKYCYEVKVEPIVMIKDQEDAEQALSVGVKCLCMHKLEETGLLELRSKLPDAVANNELHIAARLRPEADFSTYSEIDLSWVLRDNGFTGVWPSPEAVYAMGMTDIYPSVAAFKAKAARQFLSPRQFMMDRIGEGAKEYLGDILY